MLDNNNKNNNNQLSKNYNKKWEKIEKLMRIDFESKLVYGDHDDDDDDDDDKYIKTKMKKICRSSDYKFS